MQHDASERRDRILSLSLSRTRSSVWRDATLFTIGDRHFAISHRLKTFLRREFPAAQSDAVVDPSIRDACSPTKRVAFFPARGFRLAIAIEASRSTAMDERCTSVREDRSALGRRRGVLGHGNVPVQGIQQLLVLLPY